MGTEYNLPNSLLKQLPTIVRNELERMPFEKQKEFIEEYNRKHKSIVIAYVLWFLLGWHYAYLGKWGWQIFYWLTLGGLLIWLTADLFRIPWMISNFNKDRAVDVLENLKVISRQS